MSVIQQKIIIMFMMMALGYLCGKIKLITPEVNRGLSNLSLLVVNPLLTFVSYQTDYSPEIAMNLLYTLILAVAAIVIQLLLSFVLVRRSGPEYRIERLSVVLSNCGFIGIPLVQSLYGNIGVIYLTAFITVFNILVWTYGIQLMSGKATLRDMLLNFVKPALAAVFLGVIFFFCRIRLPEILLEPMTAVGNMNTPLAMLVAGATLAHTNLLASLKKPKSYLLCAYKLLLLPLAVLLALYKTTALGVQPIIVSVVLVAAACPTATIITMFAHKYNKNSVYSSELFALSTLFSVVTLPFVLWVASLLGI